MKVILYKKKYKDICGKVYCTLICDVIKKNKCILKLMLKRKE